MSKLNLSIYITFFHDKECSPVKQNYFLIYIRNHKKNQIQTKSMVNLHLLFIILSHIFAINSQAHNWLIVVFISFDICCHSNWQSIKSSKLTLYCNNWYHTNSHFQKKLIPYHYPFQKVPIVTWNTNIIEKKNHANHRLEDLSLTFLTPLAM